MFQCDRTEMSWIFDYDKLAYAGFSLKFITTEKPVCVVFLGTCLSNSVQRMSKVNTLVSFFFAHIVKTNKQTIQQTEQMTISLHTWGTT